MRTRISACRLLVCAPFPIPNFRQVLAVLVDGLLALDQLVLELLLQVAALVAGLRQVVVGLTIFRAECDSMIPYQVKVHAFGVHRVAAELARHSAG